MENIKERNNEKTIGETAALSNVMYHYSGYIEKAIVSGPARL
jgi:hypothetical protein